MSAVDKKKQEDGTNYMRAIWYETQAEIENIAHPSNSTLAEEIDIQKAQYYEEQIHDKSLMADYKRGILGDSFHQVACYQKSKAKEVEKMVNYDPSSLLMFGIFISSILIFVNNP